MNRNAKIGLMVAGIAAAVWYFKHTAVKASAQNSKGVTATAKGGVNVSPINSSAVAALGGNFVKGISSAVDFAARAVRSTASAILPSQGDKLAPQGNAISARAAFVAPIRADYRPSSLINQR